ncbi:MAG: hypothetical protein BWY09_03032 [Candidatus Hydrogenedentes bacterium ADurb.Bin179]|nr:MAG: hypothetical protein BWY09_03032 [Candidatus Hydrogenedentes bacterium ADurb.Bin179]
MGVAQRVRHQAQYPDNGFEFQAVPFLQPLTHGFTFHIFHGIEQDIVGFAGIEYFHDARMIEASRGCHFADEPRNGIFAARVFRVKHFQRHFPSCFLVINQVDGAHAAPSEFLAYLVPLREHPAHFQL